MSQVPGDEAVGPREMVNVQSFVSGTDWKQSIEDHGKLLAAAGTDLHCDPFWRFCSLFSTTSSPVAVSLIRRTLDRAVSCKVLMYAYTRVSADACSRL